MRFEAVKVLWQRFCEKFRAKDKKAAKVCVVKAVEPQSKQEISPDRCEIEWQSTAEARLGKNQLEYWRWIKAYEYYDDINFSERYERQERIAQKIMNRHHIDRMLIHYNY